jgi:exosortase
MGRSSLVVVAILAATILWSYWPLLSDMAEKWAQDPQYSHAYLVPLFAAYLLWFRRALVDTVLWRASWLGLPLLAAGVLMRLAGAYFYFDWLQATSLLPLLAGVILLTTGPRALQWAWPAVAFLVFMIPLPFRVETALSLPLQRIATSVSTYVLQTVGRPALAEGNVIIINDARIGVVEACNGLGMLILFFAMTVAVAIVVRRHPLEKAIIIASTIPVAIAANVARIAATCFAVEFLNDHWADLMFHDLAGWLMMPLALVLLGLELYVMSRLFVDGGPVAMVAAPRRAMGPAAPVPVSAR